MYLYVWFILLLSCNKLKDNYVGGRLMIHYDHDYFDAHIYVIFITCIYDTSY